MLRDTTQLPQVRHLNIFLWSSTELSLASPATGEGPGLRKWTQPSRGEKGIESGPGVRIVQPADHSAPSCYLALKLKTVYFFLKHCKKNFFNLFK